MKIEEVSFETIAEIHRKISEFDTSDTSSPSFFAKRTAGKKTLAIAAKKLDVNAGYIVAYDKYEDGSFYCWMAGVIPEARRQGILRAMMKYLVDWAQKYGYTSIRIKTRNNRRGMLEYLVREGYDIIGITRHTNRKDHRITLLKDITL